jgi:hypothetical protein
MQEVVDKLNVVLQYLDDIQNLKEQHSSAMQDVDYRISDILHLIELNKIPDSCCKKIVEELKTLREIRRDLKNQNEILRTYDTHKEKLASDKSRFLFTTELNKTIKRLGCEYNNRVYTQEELDAFLKPLRGRPKKEETKCCSENVEQSKINSGSQCSTTESNANNES